MTLDELRAQVEALADLPGDARVIPIIDNSSFNPGAEPEIKATRDRKAVHFAICG